MANGFDRLERFFAPKRKPSQAALELSGPPSQVAEPQFPSPSFIRPKTSRMAAREEVRLRQVATRSPSVPNIAASQPKSLVTRPFGSSDDSRRAKQPLGRSPSFNSRQPDALVTNLKDFQFPKPPSRNGELSALPVTAISVSETSRVPSPRSRSPIELKYPVYRTDTPPSSDPEDSGSDASKTPLRLRKLPSMPFRAPPTPGQSPELGPIPDRELRSAKSFNILDKSLFRDIHLQLGESFEKPVVHRSNSQSSLTASSHISSSSSVLREPDFNDFLNLSDDDIAESTLESDFLDSPPCSEPELPPMNLSISSSKLLPSTLLTLTPPRASKPATAAAFEAARIANRYDFDLVYVVNLWPDHSTQMDDPKTLQAPLIGRLLAAHGLHHVPSPLQISSAVHTTILRSDGWIEYRNEDAQSQDLARGYASAFYTGQYTRNGSERSDSPVSGVRLSEKIDRGIVFAAYRKPRIGESKLGRGFTEEELGDLHRDAEVLVEMLIDIHVANRLRQPPTSSYITDETGPMPNQQPDLP